MLNILLFCQWLRDTPVSVSIRESVWTYPIIESVHVLGLGLFIGLLLFWDMRLLGFVLRRVPVSALWRQIVPWITVGALLMVISGGLLFWSDPVRFYGNIFFRIKLVAMLFAAINAAAFHLGIERRLVQWDTAAITPVAAKIAGGTSIVLWTLIVVCGRLIAYNWFSPRA